MHSSVLSSESEIEARWERDRASFPGLRNLRLRQIAAGLSDPHNGGRTVARLVFDDGRAIFYKPRPVGMEAGYAELLSLWPELRAATVIDRGDYGWMPEVVAAPCSDPARYSRALGAHLALIDLLLGVDIHAENLVACGNDPVLIDLETLFHPGGEADDDLMRTEMLPRKPRAGAPYVVCGLGVVPRGVRVAAAGWYTMPLDGRTDIDADAAVTGFTTMHAFFLKNRVRLWGRDQPVGRAFLGRRARVLRRATTVYRALVAQLLASSSEDTRDAVLARVAADERDALRRLDVPYFLRDTADVFVFARERAARIDDAAIDQRVETIRNALASV